MILVVGIISFAYSTVLGWAYYGERCVEYFSGKKGLIPYRVLYIAVAAISPVISLNLVWTVADILNALMAIPNLIAVLLLSNVIVKETKKYINDLDARDDTPVEVSINKKTINISILYNKVTAPTASHITKQSELSVYKCLLHFFIIHPALSSLRTQ
mgnify:CR=1 FL=1